METDQLRAVAAVVDAVDGLIADHSAPLPPDGPLRRLLLSDSASGDAVIVEFSEDPAIGVELLREQQVLGTIARELEEGGVLVPRIIAVVSPDQDEERASAGLAVRARRPLPGSRLRAEDLDDAELLIDLAVSLARIHALDSTPLADAGLPVRSPEEVRTGLLDDLDRAAASGLVPAVLLNRWEHDLEDVRLWRFPLQVVHGAFSEADALFDGSRITAIRHWSGAHVGDPARDLRWLVGTLEPDAVDAFYRDYSAALPHAEADALRLRAELLAELDLVAWLLAGLDADDQDMIADARGLMTELAEMLQAPAEPITAPHGDHGEPIESDDQAADDDGEDDAEAPADFDLQLDAERSRGDDDRRGDDEEPVGGAAESWDRDEGRDRGDSADASPVDPGAASDGPFADEEPADDQSADDDPEDDDRHGDPFDVPGTDDEAPGSEDDDEARADRGDAVDRRHRWPSSDEPRD